MEESKHPHVYFSTLRGDLFILMPY